MADCVFRLLAHPLGVIAPHFAAILMLASIVKNVRLMLGRSLRETGQALDRVGSRWTRDVAYMERYSRHRKLMPINELWPSHGKAYIAPSAGLVGDVQLGNDSVVWYGAVIKGDQFSVRIGDSVVIGENSSITNLPNLPNGIPSSTNIASSVVIGANCSLTSCTIDSFARVGAGSVIQAGARLERGSVVLPGSVVSPGCVVSAYTVWSGTPAHYLRDVTSEDLSEFQRVLAEEREAGDSHSSVLKALGHL